MLQCGFKYAALCSVVPGSIVFGAVTGYIFELQFVHSAGRCWLLLQMMVQVILFEFGYAAW
ncbi:hypothetical protein Tco_1541174, partial [Tanacetum coccineum]